MKLRIANVLLLLPVLMLNAALASPGGELDAAFGDHGRILLREERFQDTGGDDVFIDPVSGRLLVVGDGWPGDILLRFNSDGSLDPGFGNNGSASINFGGDHVDIHDIAWLANGDLLVVGAANVYGDASGAIYGTALLARLHADGSTDTQFGEGGRVAFYNGGIFESLNRIVLQADGSIVVLGISRVGDSAQWLLARLLADGSLDATFGNSATPGISRFGDAGVDAKFKSIVQQSGGGFLLCGDAASETGTPAARELLAMRVLANGIADPAFGNQGMVLIGSWPDSLVVNTCAELADAHVAFAGIVGSSERQRAAVWRMTPDGKLDKGFGNQGMLALDTAIPSSAENLSLLADGSLAIAGTQWQPSNGRALWADMLVTRIDPVSGAIDQDFGDRGITVIDFGARGFRSMAVPTRLRQQPDGKLLVVGTQIDLYDWYPAYSVAMARIDPYGAGSNGWAGLTDTYLSVAPTATTLEIRVRRTGGGSGTLSVDYRTVDGSATAGLDYVEHRGTLSWPDGDMTDRVVSIAILNAIISGDSKQFVFELANSSGGLALDQTVIGITSSTGAPSGPFANPPGNRGNGGNSGNNNSGGGAIGIELLLLLLFARRRLRVVRRD